MTDPRPTAGPDDGLVDATRRTHLAAERTYLAWFRSSLAALAVSIGVGRLIPDLIGTDSSGPFVVLGIGYGILGTLMLVFASMRLRRMRTALHSGRFEPVDERLITVLTALGLILAIATIILIAVEA